MRSWDDNCGWTKLRIFELEGYGTILYIDADCLVAKDVGHLLRIDETKSSDGDDFGGNGETPPRSERATGLLADAPDIFPPDKFNASVMVRPPNHPLQLLSKVLGNAV